MTVERREQLAQQLSDALSGLEDPAIRRINAIFLSALSRTTQQIGRLLDRFEARGEEDPRTTPGAFLGSTPEGIVPITPEQKNQAALYLQGQLLQDLRRLLDAAQLTPRQQQQLDATLRRLFDRAQDAATDYTHQMVRDALQPALSSNLVQPGGQPDEPGRYQTGQRFTRLLDVDAAVAAAERDFKSLADNYARQRDAATDARVRTAKNYYAKWWRHWGDTVSFMVGQEMAAGPDPRRVKKVLVEKIPTINEAFTNRAETIARTETLIASGEAQERGYRNLRVGFVQYVATIDDRTCDWCAPRAGCLYWIGSVKTPIHPNCLLGDTPVSPGSIIAATRARYRGNIVTIATSTGDSLSCTENHLVLTTKGWIPAHLLRKGMKVVRQSGEIHTGTAMPDLHHQPALVRDVFDALAAAGPVSAAGMPPSTMHFHGDGGAMDGQIDVVWANRQLRDHLQAYPLHAFTNGRLNVADAQLASPSGLSPLDLRLLALHSAASGLVGSSDLAASLLSGHLRPFEQFRFTAAAWGDPGFDQPMADGAAINAEALCQLIHAGAAGVELCDVIDIQIKPAHDDGIEVFDLSTASGAYFAGGLLTHNCRCDLVPITLEGLAVENAIAASEEDTWEAQARRFHDSVRRRFEEANGEGAAMRPTGGRGEYRGPGDYPLMERTRLPTTRRRRAVPVALDPSAQPWPSGDPVWCPRRGWLDLDAERFYNQMRAMAEGLGD
jgi:hypothetical protein